MPRLPVPLVVRARNISLLLPLLLQPCRTLRAARNELRWLREHALSLSRREGSRGTDVDSLLLNLCRRRSRGVPLQYLLGSQPFGELDILCRRGVLIPRPETEAYVIHLASFLEQDEGLRKIASLRILDLCTGSGCIALLLYGLLVQRGLNVRALGVDIASSALKLARDNLKHNVRQGHLNPDAAHNVLFIKGDILSEKCDLADSPSSPRQLDIIISNPPYISQTGFETDVERSVRNWEPKLALVPPTTKAGHPPNLRAEDIFYHRILGLAGGAKPSVLLMEVGGTQQALRVAQVAARSGFWSRVEIWGDWPDQGRVPDIGAERDEMKTGGHTIPFRGAGRGRSVFCRR